MIKRHPGITGESLRGPESRRRLEHLRTCAPCRARLAEEDAAALFALLRLKSPPAAVLDEMSEHLDEMIRRGESRGGRPRHRFPAMAGWAAALALAALLAGMLGGPDRQVGNQPVRSRMASSCPVTRADVEVRSPSPKTRVVDLSVGDAQVVMIFDEEMDL